MLTDVPKNNGAAVASAVGDASRGGALRGASAREESSIRLLTLEYQDAYVALARSEGRVLKDGMPSRRKRASAAEPLVRSRVCPEDSLKPTGHMVSLSEEMPRAVKAYDKAIVFVRELMANASQGVLLSHNADDVVEGLVASLERNVDALLCLPRMRQRDPYVYTHSVNVAVLLASFALCSGEGRKKMAVNALAGLFHDVGKALLPVALLNAKRKLSQTEQTLVTRHPMLSCELLATQPDLHSEVILAALEHHERFDGSGYPKGIAGEDISLIGHLCGIADTYDALSSRRPYKGALIPHKTLGVLYQMRKKEFHPELIERFVRMIGIYPVGSVVELKDGYRGVVTASNYENPMLPVVTLAMDPQGGLMCRHECDMAKDFVAGIARCLVPDMSGIDPCRVMGVVL